MTEDAKWESNREKIRRAVWLRSGLDPLHYDRFTETPDASTPWGEAQAKITAMPAGYIVALLGNRGTGKTQIAQNVAGAAALNPLYENEKFAPRYITAPMFFRGVRDSFRKDSLVSEIEIMRKFSEYSILVIDEAHERGESDFENRTLTEIIDARYARQRSTILIANLDKKQFAAAVGASIVSRIHEVGAVIECNWKSFRTATKGAA
jgi:DNA replication protein DnaC